MLWTSKMLVCFYLLLLLHLNEGCRLEENRQTKEITAYTGDSGLLPCSCTDLHTKPQNFRWKKYINPNNWEQISPEKEEYKDKFQLVNNNSPGNLSLLISHLTVEDGGYYRCSTVSEYTDIRLTVEGCTLNHETAYVIGYMGQSVLLPCSCTELQAKPQTFNWEFRKDSDYEEIFPKDEKNLYTHRVQLINERPPGNLSLLISRLTAEDGGWYRCSISNTILTNIKLTVKEATEKPAVQKDSDNTVIIISSVIVAVLLLVVVGAFMYWKHRGQRRGQIIDGETGKQNDSAVLYAVCNSSTEHNIVEKKDDVMYSTIVHSNAQGTAYTPVPSEDTTVYAIIK
ncbi:uncharacterized protein LOC124401432 [Silurus meridionalis]|uniref:Ig-like domain-containing protein n=1 Tax=Silurus meridionalis TaxID=175797 RepID=A0A8T0AR24_SILME|nr:uncharacterized protein LOC124401432 [Silurus meridionalis]KAF7694451.1 hypothetical protein HF521_008204 [Silurus meridionalis]